jgi:outer membrane lipoprotein-sorting protein
MLRIFLTVPDARLISRNPKGKGEVRVRRIVGLLCLGAFWAIAVPASSQDVHDGQTLLTAMHERYKSSWYESVIFKEKAITNNPDGTSKTDVWDEALLLPGRLRINIEPVSDGNGVVFVDGTVTRFRRGKPPETRPFVHMLLVLGFDVYRQDPKATIEQVKAQGFDLKLIHEDKWEGQDVYVVGAAKGDLKSKQFWIEKKRLLFVRLIEPDETDATKIHDTLFKDYRKLPTGWISARVEFYVNGKDTFDEDYFDIAENTKLDSALFDLKKFSETSISFDKKQ